MTVDSINRRLDKLAARYPDETQRRVIRLILGEDDETQDEAIVRWRAENPDQAAPGQPNDFIILRTLVSSPNAKRD
jgi:hypothetical protein